VIMTLPGNEITNLVTNVTNKTLICNIRYQIRYFVTREITTNPNSYEF